MGFNGNYTGLSGYLPEMCKTPKTLHYVKELVTGKKLLGHISVCIRNCYCQQG